MIINSEEITEIISHSIGSRNFHESINELKKYNADIEKTYLRKKGSKSLLYFEVILFILSILCIYTLFIYTSVWLFSSNANIKHLLLVVVLCILLLCDIVILRFVLKDKMWNKRINDYSSLLKYYDELSLEELSSYFKVNVTLVEKDITKAIEQGDFLTGNFNKDHTIYINNKRLYSSYIKEPEKYDKRFFEEKNYRLNSEEGNDVYEKFNSDIQKYYDRIDARQNEKEDEIITLEQDRIKKKLDFIRYEVCRNPKKYNDPGEFINFYVSSMLLIINNFDDTERVNKRINI